MMKMLYVLGPILLGLILTAAGSYFLTLDIAAFIGFVVAVALIVYFDRKNVKLEGIMLMRRTTRGKDFIDKIAKISPNGWRFLANIGVVLGIVLMIGGSALMASQAYAVATGAEEGGVKLLLPGPVSTPVNGPGVFVVPWWIWIIGIAFVIIPHEFCHGIMCRIDNVRIKSVGWVLLAVIPGAFVEPDEKQLKKQKKMTKLRVYAAGSFANMLMTLLVVVLFSILISATFTPGGVFVGTVEGGAAFNASINGSIVSIDGTNIVNREALSYALSQHKPGDTITVGVAETLFVVPSLSGIDFFVPKPLAIVTENVKDYTVTLAENDGKAYMGVLVIAQAGTLNIDVNTYATIATLLLWMFLFSFGIGMVNMLPIGPLDGGQFFGELSGGRKRLAKYVTIIMVALLLFNLLGPLFL